LIALHETETKTRKLEMVEIVLAAQRDTQKDRQIRERKKEMDAAK
jgi:hypothetical protein